MAEHAQHGAHLCVCVRPCPQLEGVVAGYNAQVAGGGAMQPLTFDDLLLLNTFGQCAPLCDPAGKGAGRILGGTAAT